MNTNQAVALIADIDPALANLWASNPFQRHNIVTAFHAQLCKGAYAAFADRIAVVLRSVIDLEQSEYTTA